MTDKRDLIIKKIVSGGQTGVDQAALDFALDHEIPCGGWCPKGRKSETGKIPTKYPLKETTTAHYRERTEMNARDSDGTLILTWGEPSGGTLYTIRMLQRHRRPYYVLDLENETQPSKEDFKVWIEQKNVEILNVAGPRGSRGEWIYPEAIKVLKLLIL